jgi:hypothetical protein
LVHENHKEHKDDKKQKNLSHALAIAQASDSLHKIAVANNEKVPGMMLAFFWYVANVPPCRALGGSDQNDTFPFVFAKEAQAHYVIPRYGAIRDINALLKEARHDGDHGEGSVRFLDALDEAGDSFVRRSFLASIQGRHDEPCLDRGDR